MLEKGRARMIGAVVLVCCLVAVLAGCGGGVSSTKNAEARLAAAFDALPCGGRSMSSQMEQKYTATLRSLVKADRKLPRVAKLVSDAHAEDNLRAAMRKIADSTGYKLGALMNDLEAAYRLRVKLYADEKALGFRCIAPPRRPIEG
jgi:uncharacterized membrane protein